MNYWKVIDKQLLTTALPTPFNKLTIVVVNAAMNVALQMITDKKNTDISKVTIDGYEGYKIKAEIIAPKNTDENLPCLLYFHGGSFCYTAFVLHKSLVLKYAKMANCKVMLPAYQLAPKHKFPAGLEDGFACYKWLLDNSEKIGIDKSKIGIGGDSSGGNFAAVITNSCGQRELPTPCCQMLIYPVTDASMTSESMKLFQFSPIWSARKNVKMLKYYTDQDLSDELISPINCKFESEIPKTYIETAEYDCLRDEGLMYAQKLKDKNADVTLNETKGTYHGYDACVKAKKSLDSLKMRIEFLKESFS